MEDQDLKFRNLVQSSPMGMHMYRLEPDGRLIFVGGNPAADRLLGLDNSQFVGQTIEEAFPPLAETEIPERYRRAAAEGIPWQTNQITYADDRIAGAFEVYAFQTAPGNMAVMFLEITDRLKAEEAIRESEELFRGYFELGNIGMAISGPEKRWVHVNEVLCRMLGLTRDEMLRTTWDELTPAEDLEVELEQFDRMLAGEIDGYSLEKRFLRKGGEAAEARLFVSCIRRDDRSVRHVITHIEDITEQRSLEQQLRQSQKMEAIGRLAGGVAHDFNNILTGILGYTELVRSQLSSNDRLHAEMGEIVRAAERGAALTNQLLAFSRKQVISPKVIDLNQTIPHSERLLARIIGEDVDLVFRPVEELWRIKADPSQIDQILVNLATNSRDAMPGGGKLIVETGNVIMDELYCQANPESRAGQFVMLSVSDTGEGIDHSIRPRIFEPFFSTKSKERGTGLGLATVYGIVRQNSGFIQVYSEPGVGTTIKIYFPRVEGELEDEAQPAPTHAPGGSETVLLVEDEPMVRGLAGKVLDMQGYTVLSAADATEAITQSERHPGKIDLLLTDVILPTLNGVELHEHLSDARPGLKALFMSGYTDDVIAHHGVLREGMRFIQKPFTLHALAHEVRLALDQ